MFEEFKEKAEKVEMFGRDFSCQICGGGEFWRREAQLNTAIATFFNFDWANQSAVCLICDNCGYIHWFLPR